MTVPILRIQDKQGRGPWRPGFSDKWVDAWRTEGLPPIYEEVPNFAALAKRAHSEGMHVGCATRGIEGMKAWFSLTEMIRLFNAGYYVVRCDDCAVLVETPTQLIIASDKPLKNLPAYGAAP